PAWFEIDRSGGFLSDGSTRNSGPGGCCESSGTPYCCWCAGSSSYESLWSDTPTLRIHHGFAIFLIECAALSVRQDVQHGFRGATQASAQWGDHDRAVDENRMLDHEVDQLIVTPFEIIEAEFCIGGAIFAQYCAHRNAHGRDQGGQ